ncbi:MAG TPA: sterol desaturase family protein [Ideonella sp.]|jgi:sterol desaturase/sphingolipid hydroxylase (fatty acid hydroxylase superfamily)|nr:sterol desaturase family protein [Ideonella sp.]
MDVPFFLELLLGVLAVDLMRYLLGAGLVWLVVDVLWRQRLAGRRILEGAPRPGQIRREIAYSMATVLIFAANGTLLWLLARTGHVRIYGDASAHGGAAWWLASLVLIIVAHDAWFYWTHRLLHHRRWFALVHARHHASAHPTPWAAYSFHPVEALIQAAFLPLFVWIVPTHAGVIVVFLLHMIVRNAIGHSGHELMPWALCARGPLRWLTTVSHHHFHHAKNRGNYGLYFSWWDRWCGTEDAQHLTHGEQRFGTRARVAQDLRG